MILIGLEKSFGSILLKCHPIGVCEDLDHSALGHFVPSSFVLNPADTSWAAFNYYLNYSNVSSGLLALVGM